MEHHLTKSRVIFVGDPHFDSRTPLSRADNHADTTINKLENLLQQAIEYYVGTIIFTGDFFNGNDQTQIYLNRLIKTLNKFKDVGIDIYTIVGNHDLPHDKFEYFVNTPLYMLFTTGVIKHLDLLEIATSNKTVAIHGLDFTKRDNLQDLLDNIEHNYKHNYHVLVMHYATNNTVPKDDIPMDNLHHFNMVVSGHDHTEYDLVNYGSTTLVRPGSMVRRTKDVQNLDRVVKIAYVDFETDAVAYYPLKGQEPSNVVFKNEVFNNDAGTLKADIAKLFTDSYFKKETVTLGDIIEALPPTLVNPNTKETLTTYIEGLGLK